MKGKGLGLGLGTTTMVTVVLAGCLGGEDTRPLPGELGFEGHVQGDHHIEIADSAFVPAVSHVAPGETVLWWNHDAVQHTVVPMDPDAWGSDGSGTRPDLWLQPGRGWSFSFAEPGVYRYVCVLHSTRIPEGGEWVGMTGTIVVEEDA
ncbi:MAG: plastocyanin/azurin family copper-binding protein [Methanobacteriota archaeon]